jgi:dipeptidyl aminopeptidase/acylaminoacyl peptidase
VRSAIAVLVLILAPLPALAQGRSLTYDDFYRLESVGQVALSPDGASVAFVRSRVLEAENRTHSEVWLVPTDGSGAPYRLTNPAAEASNPRWSPDGTVLAFASRRPVPGEAEPNPNAWWFLRMDRPSGEASRVRGLEGAPVFDPTDRWIAYTKPVLPSGPPPAESQPATDAERKIAERFDGKAYDWMNYRFDRRGYLPDPRDPWATPPDQLFLVPREGGEPRQLTDLDVSVESPAWHPQAQALAFVADAHEREERSYERADLWTVSVEGAVTRLTDDQYTYGAPAWSPDGRFVVVRGNVGLDVVIRERWDHGAPIDLFLFRADGSGRVNLTEDWDLIPGTPAFSADGSWLYFTAGIAGNAHLFRVQASGGPVEQVTSGDHHVQSVSFSADGSRYAYVLEHPTDPGNVHVADLGGPSRQLTDVNAGLLAELALRSPERLTYRSSDGTEVEGWVLPPLGYRESEGSWPMILTIHGGPHGAYGNTFAFDRHLMSGAGYFVLFTNPRASTGYGEEFRWGTWGSWGDEDYDDVMKGVDAALARYPIDEERLGVTGYSYGGYLTNWIITQTDRFGAAVAGASISNWVSDYGVADIPRTKESEFFGPPWEEEGLANLLRASPIVHAKGVSTPTLFVHGESDHRVPIEEAEQMYVALHKQGVPAKFIRYPDSYHGGWTPWRYVHRVWSTMGWFDQYLAGQPMS